MKIMIVIVLLAITFGHCQAQFLHKAFPVNATLDMHMDTELLVSLESSTPLPEPSERGGQLNWPIYISPDTLGNVGRFDDIVVDKIKVRIRGLHHEQAGDLHIKVSHQASSSILSGNRGDVKTFGEPAPREYGELFTRDQARKRRNDNLLPLGTGYEYTFSDLIGNNIAQGCSGEQSSTMNGDNTASWRATDGDIVVSGMATRTEENPWYQVDLGSTEDIGTVVLWAPDPENQVKEIQIVKTTGLVTLGGYFRLAINHNGFTKVTDEIQHNAVAGVLYEDPDSLAPGLGRGESMQSKLQALDNIGLVSVTRGPADRTGGYEWTITFLTEHSDVDEIMVHENALTAGPNRLPEDQVATVTVTTAINGTKNTYYNANMKYGSVLVSDTPFGNATLAQARAIASVEKRFDISYRQRQINVPMPTNTQGRYIRIVLRQRSYLSISEILVFAEELVSIRAFAGGSPIPQGNYVPEDAFSDTFGGMEIHGTWMLTITDRFQERVEYEQKARRRQIVHGTGAISDWVLEVIPRNRLTGEVFENATLVFYSDLSASILTLPKYGKLYIAEAYVKGELIEAKKGMEMYVSECAPIDCNHKYGVGNFLSTDRSGSTAQANQIRLERHVVYVPNPNFRGQDSFTYKINVGTLPGEYIGTIRINVKKCRIHCRNDRLFGLALSVDESLRTPWDNRDPSPAPPDKVLQPDIYGNKLWNDPFCASPPCNVFETPVP